VVRGGRGPAIPRDGSDDPLTRFVACALKPEGPADAENSCWLAIEVVSRLLRLSLAGPLPEAQIAARRMPEWLHLVGVVALIRLRSPTGSKWNSPKGNMCHFLRS